MGKRENYIQELVDYVKKNLKKGYTVDSLRWALISQGHSKIEVERAIKRVDESLSAEAPIMKTSPEIKYEVIEPKGAIIQKKSLWRRIFGL